MHIDVDAAVAHFDGKCVEIVAAARETAAAFHVVAPAVPVTRQDAVANAASSQRITHVRTLVVRRIDAALMLEERNAAAADLDCSWGAFRDVRQIRHFDEVCFADRHFKILYCSNTSTVVLPSAKRIAVLVADPLSL